MSYSAADGVVHAGAVQRDLAVAVDGQGLGDHDLDARSPLSARGGSLSATGATVGPPASSPSDLAARAGRGTLSRSLVVALQRSAGNRAVHRLVAPNQGVATAPVQRDAGAGSSAAPATSPAAPAEWNGGPVPAGMVKAAPPAIPTMSGVTTATRAGDLVTVVGPKASMAAVTADVDLATHPMAADKSIHVGFVQTVSRSQRRAVYESPPEQPGGDPVRFEQDLGTPGARRDVAQVRNSAQDKPFSAAEAPFFLQPGAISKSNPSATVSGTTPGRDGFDQPSMAVETKIGTGMLVAINGREDFQTSFAAKPVDGPAGQLTHLSTSAWGFSWAVQGLGALANGAQATGRGGAASASKDAPSVVDGPTAKDSARAYLVFTSVDAAMTQSVAVLLDNLSKASEAGDEDTVGFTNAALRAKNPKYSVTLTCKKTDAWVGRDTVRFHIGKTSADTTKKLKEGETVTLEFQLNDVADGRADQASANVWVDIGSAGLDNASWSLTQPSFAATLTAGSGSYTVAGKLVS